MVIYQFPIKSFTKSTLYGAKGKTWAAGFHPGLDLIGKGDLKVYPICAGTVKAIDTHGAAYGRHITIVHDDGYLSLYAHLEKIYVRAGDRVFLETAIGKEGSTGNSTGRHLHLEIHKGKYSYPARIDPLSFLQERAPADWAADAWHWAEQVGLLDGSNPKGNLSRQEFAAVLQRFTEKYL